MYVWYLGTVTNIHRLWFFFSAERLRPWMWSKFIFLFGLSRLVEDLVLRGHLGLRGTSGSSNLSFTSCSVSVRISFGSTDCGFPWKQWEDFFSVFILLFVDLMLDIVETSLNKRTSLWSYRKIQGIAHSPLGPQWPWNARRNYSPY